MGIKARYITTMDFEFENVTILNCDTEQEIAKKIKENEIVKIDNQGRKENINSSYIMFYELMEE